MSAQTEIFVSYAWRGASEALVDQLCEAFAARGYRITRDKSAMTYKDSIQQFMERIGRGRYIIAVVSDKYMKSEYCMYEAYRMFQSPAFRERLFPIVLPDADVFSFRGQAAYLKYWDQAYKELEAEYRAIASSSPTMVAPLTERLRDIETTTRFINDFMAAVGDMNVLTSDIHLESNFQALIAAIEVGIQKSEAKENDTMSDENPKNQTKSTPEAGLTSAAASTPAAVILWVAIRSPKPKAGGLPSAVTSPAVRSSPAATIWSARRSTSACNLSNKFTTPSSSAPTPIRWIKKI
ncbi:MAG TPA: hypothetical protein DEH25_14000 [Chloroflexi bacterium]|nr:hypothetical protein [Chloroflexota bacterium]HBY08694.1 hypothetical protein [Chloroflexota bacterium]